MKTNLPQPSSGDSSCGLFAFSVVLLLAALPCAAAPFGTEFTYQGRLNAGAAPANGTYDLRFAIHDSLSAGTQQGNPLTNSATSVSNGLFTVALDFGAGIFTGEARWLEIGVRTNGSVGAYATLSPRQPLTPTPYAIYAANAGAAVIASGVAPGAVTSSGLASGSVGGTAIADGSITSADLGPSLLNSTFWKLGGNAGTTPGVNFLGTTDNQSLSVKVNNTIALQFVPGTSLPNVVGGLAGFHPSFIASGVSGAVIAGGNAPSGGVSGFGGGDFQAVYDNDGTVGGGFGNKVGSNNGDITDGAFATVAGGVFNSAADYASTVAGGDGNYAAGSRAAIGGGYGNQVYSAFSAIAGGLANVIQTNSSGATISGGQNNSVSPGDIGYVSAKGASIGGGEGNTIFGFGQFPETALYNEYGTISGGYSNKVQGSYGTVPGGYLNTASGEFSLAAGRRAKANHTGSFVWADTQNADFASTSDNQFNIRAANGVRLNTDTSLFFGNSGASKLWPDQGGAIELGNSTAVGVTPYIDFHYGFGSAQDFNVRIMNEGTETLSIFRFGSATRMAQFSPAGLSVNGTFVSTSDRNAKENFRSVNGHEVLDKVVALPLSRWNYKDDKASAHIGPMAQDFYAAFGVGPDDKHIATVDADGVALAAIQGLDQKVESGKLKVENQLAELLRENADLKARLEKLERLMTEKNGGGK
jgi:trimeric autotransporter adhesin